MERQIIDEILNVKTYAQQAQEIALRMVKRRKELGISQQQLASKAGVSYGSIKRFETSGEISLKHLLKIAYAIECENDFDELFKKENIVPFRR